MTKKPNIYINQTQQIPPTIYKMPLIGEPAPPFKAQTTKGPVNFPFDYAGKWVIFFSHPGDFEPVCTTEFIAFQQMQQEFKDLNAELLGLSVDSVASHLGWLDSIYNIKFEDIENISINFPIVADPTMEVSRRYGMVHRGETETKTIRALFIIDPDSKVRTILYYANTNGRNLEEVKRVLIALQTTDAYNVLTPVNWESGDDVILRQPKTTNQLLRRYGQEQTNPNIYCLTWYLCFLKEPLVKQENKNLKPNYIKNLNLNNNLKKY